MEVDAHSSISCIHVLLVEWNATLRSVLSAWLHQEFPGYQVETAASREQAERMAADSPLVLVLVNIDAYQGEGFATLHSLRTLQPDALLVALSLYPVAYFRESAMCAGAVQCACIALAHDDLRNLLCELLPPLRAPATRSTPSAS